MDSSDEKVDSSEERLSSGEEDPVDDPKDADFEVPDDDEEEEEDDEFMEEDEALPRRRRSLPRGQPEEEEDAPPRRRRSATKLNEDEVDESTEEPPPRRRSSTKLAEDEDEPTEEPPPEPTEEPPVPASIRNHNTAPEAQVEEPVYTDTGRRKRSAAKKVNYDDSVRDKDFFRAVNKHDADKYPDNGHLSEGDDEILSDDESDSDGPRKATAKKWKEPVEKKKKRGRPRKQDKDEAPPPVLDPSDGAAAMVLRMQKPPYDVLKTPWANRDPEVFATSSTIETVEGRDTWKELLPEMMWVLTRRLTIRVEHTSPRRWRQTRPRGLTRSAPTRRTQVCNEAARRQAVSKNRGARYFDKPLAADYMYDRVALAADEPWGLVCRDNESKQMQGFCMLGTFASWDKTLRWASRDPRAWGVADYDPNCGRRIRVNARHNSDDEFDDADLADISDPRARADEKKLRAYIAAATQAAKSAADLAMAEKRDTDGVLSDALEATACQVCSSDARMTEWPDVLEVSLLGGLGCGGLLLKQCLEQASTRTYTTTNFDNRQDDDDLQATDVETRPVPTYVALQATESAVPFYERHGFRRVGALAKYRDRRDMPELAYRHWNDRIMVSQTHGASHMMALELSKYDGPLEKCDHANAPKATKPDPADTAFREKAREEVMDVARSAIGCNTNVIGGSGVFRELVVLAQGRAGPWGANDDDLSRSLARVLVVFKSNACGSAKSVLRDEVLGGEDCGFSRRRSSRPRAPKKFEAYEDPDHAPLHMRTQALSVRVRCPVTETQPMAVEAVPVEEEEEEEEEELTPEELSCEACRGRHVKHTCGTDPEERKAKKRAQAEARRAKAQKAAERKQAMEQARQAALEAAKPPYATPPELIAVIGTKQSSTRDSTVQIRVKLKAEGLQLIPVALFPKKLKKKARSTHLAGALASVRRKRRESEPPSPRKKPSSKKRALDDDDAPASSPKKLRKPPKDDDVYEAPPLQPSDVLSDCPSDVEEDILSRPDNGLRIRFKWDAPYGWGEAKIRRNAFKKEVLRDDRGVQVPKERTWLITCEDGEQMLVALNPEFRGTSRRHNWYAARPRSKAPKRRGPPRSR